MLFKVIELYFFKRQDQFLAAFFVIKVEVKPR